MPLRSCWYSEISFCWAAFTTASQPVDGGVVLSYEIGKFETAAGTVAAGTAEAEVDADGVCCVVFLWASSLDDENGDDTKSVTSSRCNDEGVDTVPV